MKFSILAAFAICSSGVLGFQQQQQQHVFDSHYGNVDVSLDSQPGSLYDTQRLIQTDPRAPAQWMSLEEIQRLRQQHIGFMDITDAQDLQQSFATTGYTSKLPTTLSQQELVKKANSLISTKLYGDVLKPFTAFHNRYYDSANGQKSSQWLQQQVERLASGSGSNVTVSAFKHRFAQPSVIARWEPLEDSGETVVISAHQDSVNLWLPWYGRAPGADDDGSGTVTILEALRVMMANRGQQPPRRAVEFHWYAGEEGGLLGSQDVAMSYGKRGRKVVADMHFDMTGYWKGTEVIGLVQDNTDPETTRLVEKLAKEYTRLKTVGFSCGYGCSDHASWNKAGVRSAMAFESAELEANTNVHSTGDTVNTLDFNHMVEFSKLAVAFAYEVGFI